MAVNDAVALKRLTRADHADHRRRRRKSTLSYAIRQSRSCTPLPVSVFNWRLSGGSYGFSTANQRHAALQELRAMFGSWLSIVSYRDTQALYALQVFVWLPGQTGGCRFTGRHTLVSSITHKTVVSLLPCVNRRRRGE